MRYFLFSWIILPLWYCLAKICEGLWIFHWQTSCEEYLCDLLCFHLDLASFVSSVNSGHPWNLRNSLLFSQQEQDSVVNAETLDPFVENMILERLAVQTPMRVSSLIWICDLISLWLYMWPYVYQSFTPSMIASYAFWSPMLVAKVTFGFLVDSLMPFWFIYLLAGAVWCGPRNKVSRCNRACWDAATFFNNCSFEKVHNLLFFWDSAVVLHVIY